MTAKRFETNMRLVIDTEKKYGARVLNAEEVVDLLNKLSEENEPLKKENKELKYHLNRTEKELPKDKNGYTKIICPMCGSDLKYSRFISYMNGEQYEEFDCTQCDFTGRIRKGNLWDDFE